MQSAKKIPQLRQSYLEEIPFLREGVRRRRTPSPRDFIYLLTPYPRITYEIKPGIFDEKRGMAALLIKNSGFYFIFNPKE